jgi:hypothetical protein
LKSSRTIEYLTGFIMGFILGFGLDLLFYLYNLACQWLGCTQVKITWWLMLPIPILAGLFMSKAIANFHLEDY